jgi:hypothetical protein
MLNGRFKGNKSNKFAALYKIFNTKTIYMKRTGYFIGIILVFCIINTVNAQPTINNSGFENWDNLGQATEEPTDWNSFKTASGSPFLLTFAAQQVARSTQTRPGSTGTYSAVIWSKDLTLAIANGNLTTGQVNMGNSVPTNQDNYNVTHTADPNFSEALGSKPDSMIFWVKFVPSNSGGTDSARMHAIIHDTYDYRDPSGSDANGPSHVVGEALRHIASTNGQWIRESVPFIYNGPASSPDYILITFTTNKIQGGGSGGDSLYIDDLQLIDNDFGIQDNVLGAISGVIVEQTAQNLMVTISNTKAEETSVSIYNIASQLIRRTEKEISNSKEIISLAGMKRGLYFVDVIRAGEPRFMQKFSVH